MSKCGTISHACAAAACNCTQPCTPLLACTPGLACRAWPACLELRLFAYPRAAFRLPARFCRANLQECGVQGTVQQVADRCASEADCAAIIFKPGGLGEASITSSLGLLRRPSGANATLMVVNPSTLVYMKEVSSSSSSSGSSSSSSLSAGAIAGIAAGCAVLAVAMAAGGWVALRRRRQRRMQHGELSDAAPKAADEAGGPRSVLGLPPPAPSFAPSSPQAPLSIGTSAPSQNGTSFGAANSHSSPPAAGQHVAHIKLRPVAAASPFASMRQMRMTGSTGTAGSAGSAFTPRSTAAPATGVSQPELHHMMSELMQFRAREDAATGMPSPSSLGPPVPALGSNSGSGGGPSSGGQLSSGGPNTAGTARSSGSGPLPSGHLGRETLPLSLQDWLIPADAIQFDQGTTGELAVLGEGARCGVARQMLPPWLARQLLPAWAGVYGQCNGRGHGHPGCLGPVLSTTLPSHAP